MLSRNPKERSLLRNSESECFLRKVAFKMELSSSPLYFVLETVIYKYNISINNLIFCMKLWCKVFNKGLRQRVLFCHWEKQSNFSVYGSNWSVAFLFLTHCHSIRLNKTGKRIRTFWQTKNSKFYNYRINHIPIWY